MSRSARSRSIGPLAWVIGLVLVVGGLVALFSLKPGSFLAKEWPLGIRATEVRTYAAWLDRRPVEVAGTIPDVYLFGGSKGRDSCLFQERVPGWRTRWFSTNGYADSVRMRPLTDGPGYLVKFKKKALFNGQRNVLLIPATEQDMRAKYMEVLASKLGLLTPEITFVHLASCGEEHAVYRKEERVDMAFLKRFGLENASLVEQGLDPARPDRQFVEVKGDSAERVQLRGTVERAMAEVAAGRTDALAQLVDEDAAIAWLIMAWMDGRDLRREDLVLAHQWNTGKMIPIYQAPRKAVPMGSADKDPLAFNLLTPLLARRGFRARFDARLDALKAEAPELRAKFEALDKAWLPVLADAVSLPFAQTATRQIQYELFDIRLTKADAAAHYDRPLFAGPGHGALLAGVPVPDPPKPQVEQGEAVEDIATRYKLSIQADTIYFPRGKYEIEEDLVLPDGYSVVFLQGARLFVAPDVSVVCQGDLHVRGTLRNPVFIRPMSEQEPYGTIALAGKGTERCEIAGLLISGGTGATIQGVRYEGMLSLHGAVRTRIRSCVVENAKEATAVRIDGGGVELDNVRFEDGAGTMLHIANAQGTVRNCSFSGAGEGTTIVSSRIAVLACSYTGMQVGLRADAASEVLIKGARSERNVNALVAEGLSILHVADNTFLRNQLVLRARTGSSGNGARVMLYTNEYVGNENDREVDSGSKVEQRDAIDGATLTAFGLEAPPVVNVPTRGRGHSRRSQ